ncbi:MAG: LamG domain-containing protein, partial [Planctomycetota bacterium]
MTGTTSPGTFQGNQTATTFDPGTMANGATYYWRIDELNAGGTTTGTVWSFTTIVAEPGQASSPSPADTATDVSIDADLSWTAGTGSTSSDVYFGTTSPGTFQGNQTATNFDPGTMANDTTYYWRIDEINPGGTTTGAVWSFTTIAAAGDQLVGWWKLDESAGTNAADSSGKSYDGTLVGADWAPASGKFAGAVSFNNVDFADRVDVPVTEMSASAGSLSLWGKFPATRTGVRYFFGHTSTPATGYTDRIQVFMDNDDTQLDLGLGDNHYKHTDIMALSVDTWYHIVLTWDAGNYKVYVDTDVKATGTYTGLNTLASVASIGNDGRQTPDDGAFYGLLDDVRVYNYVLGQNDVNDLYNAGATPPGQATNPSPADSATDVSIDADLS